MTISVIVPCHYKHAIYLTGVLEAYARSTVLPDEVVISLSQAYLVSPEVVFQITTAQWPFSVTLLTWDEPISDGGNRNRACQAAHGDVFMCSDADDFPHRQRVEVAKYFFENYDVDFLVHMFGGVSHFVDASKLDWFVPQKCNEPIVFANAAPIFTRRVFTLFQWDDGFRLSGDVTFNDLIFQALPDYCMALKTSLYHYRTELSTFYGLHKTGDWK